MKIIPFALAAGLTWSADASAQNAVDVGVIQNQDVKVVQKLLYPKANRFEYGAQLGVQPFDAYTIAPVAAATVAYHFREDMGIEGVFTGGYGMKSGTYKELEAPPYGVAPDAYRFLGSAMVDFQYSPIYAKMNVAGQRIFHHDVFVTGGMGMTLEQAIQPDSTKAFSPTFGLGVGVRVFTGKDMAIRLHLRDDFVIQKRDKSADKQGTYLKQNVAFMIGFSKLGAK